MRFRNLALKFLCVSAASLCTGCGLVSKFSICAEYESLYDDPCDEEALIARHREVLQNFVRKELEKILWEINEMNEGRLETISVTLSELRRWRELYDQHELDCPQILSYMNQAIESLEAREEV